MGITETEYKDLLFKKKLDKYLRRGGKITKLKYHGPKEPKTKKNSITGKYK